MGEIIAKFEQLNAFSVALRLLLSILFGGVIGWERQGNHHPAGLRTHILVCIGSMSILELNMKSYVDSNAVLVDLLKENCVLSADYIKLQESLTEEDTDPL